MSKITHAEKPATQTSERILSFDLMRGYFLCVILLNHLSYYPNGLSALTGRGFLYASTAEGFFAVSGIVLGIVRGRKLLNQPLRVATRLLWKRAAQLYVTSLVLTVLFTLIGQHFLGNPGLKYGIFTDWSQWWTFLWQVVTLQYTYGWADFLRFYALFLAAAPAALWLIRRGYWYVATALSLGVWALFPLLPSQNEVFEPVSWQLIFFASFIIGFYWENILAAWRNLSFRVRHIIKLTWVCLFVITLLGSFYLVFGSMIPTDTGKYIQSIHNMVEQHFNKDRMPLERVLLGTLWFWGIFIVFRRFEGFLYKHFGWLLFEFGTHSLYVYTMSAFVIFFMQLMVPPPGSANWIANLILSLCAIALVWFATKRRFLMKIIPR